MFQFNYCLPNSTELKNYISLNLQQASKYEMLGMEAVNNMTSG
jgi:hypothetical protein